MELSMKEYFNNTIRNKHYSDQPGSEDVDRGKLEKRRYDNYYNVQNAIQVAGPIDPLDFDNPVYNRERIFEHMERNADILYALNTQPLGGAQLFVIESHKSMIGFSNEVPIDPQQQKEFHNIYELRLRSPLQGLVYRVSSYPVGSIS